MSLYRNPDCTTVGESLTAESQTTRTISMIAALSLLLVCQLAGELLTRLAGLPVPGPVLGMVLLFAILAISGRVPDRLRQTAETLLQHLSLLFVPAGVGVMLHAARIQAEWPAIVAALAVSTLLTIVVSG